MKSNNERRNVRRVSTLAGTLGFAGVLFWSQQAAAGSEFHARTEASVGWTDNIALVADDDPTKQSAYVAQLNPGFSWKETSQRFNSALDYTLQNVFYKDDSQRHSSFQQAFGQLGATLIPNFFFFNANGSYSQVLIDAHLPANDKNFFNVTNQTDALAIAVTPSLQHDFSQAHFEAIYSRGRVDYKRAAGALVAPNNADTETRAVLLKDVDDDALLTWLARYESQRAEYTQGTQFRFDRANAELGLLFGRTFRLIGRGGRETDPAEGLNEGGLDISTWEAGFRWQPSARTVTSAFYGHRFYGSSYNVQLQHAAKFVSWMLSYEEGPLTQAQELIASSAAGNAPVGGGYIPPVQQVPGQAPGQIIPGQGAPGQAGLQLTSQVYVRKAGIGTLRIAGSRTDIDLSVFDYRRNYVLATLQEERQDGATLAFSRQLAARMKFNISVSAAETALGDGAKYHDTALHTEFSREFSRNYQVAISAMQTRRTGGVAGTGGPGYTARNVNLSIRAQY